MYQVKDLGIVLNLPLYEADGASFMSKDAFGHPCTAAGAVWSMRGRIFDGIDDYIQIPDTPVLTFGNDDGFSVELWGHRAANTAALQHFLAKQNDYHIRCNPDGTSLCFGVRKADNSATANAVWSGAMAVDTWYHIVGTRASDDTIKLYIQGALVSAVTGSGVYHGNQPFRLGSASWGVAELLNGGIAEVRVYKRALSPVEIRMNYLLTKWRYQ